VEKRLTGSRCRLGVSVVGQRMGVLNGVEIVEGEGTVLGVKVHELPEHQITLTSELKTTG